VRARSRPPGTSYWAFRGPSPSTGARRAAANGTAAMPELGGGGRCWAAPAVTPV